MDDGDDEYLIEKFAEWQVQGLFSKFEKWSLKLIKEYVSIHGTRGLLLPKEIHLLITETNLIETINTTMLLEPVGCVLNTLSRCSSLKRIYFESFTKVGPDETDTMIKEYAKCIYLKEIYMYEFYQITDIGVDAFRHYPFLTKLELVRMRHVTNKGIQSLVHCPLLETLLLEELPRITTNGFKYMFPKFLSLKKLKLIFCPKVDRRVMKYLAKCPLLEKIKIYWGVGEVCGEKPHPIYEPESYHTFYKNIVACPKLETFSHSTFYVPRVEHIQQLSTSKTLLSVSFHFDCECESNWTLFHLCDTKDWDYKKFNKDRETKLKDTLMKILVKFPEVLVDLIIGMGPLEKRKSLNLYSY